MQGSVSHAHWRYCAVSGCLEPLWCELWGVPPSPCAELWLTSSTRMAESMIVAVFVIVRHHCRSYGRCTLRLACCLGRMLPHQRFLPVDAVTAPVTRRAPTTALAVRGNQTRGTVVIGAVLTTGARHLQLNLIPGSAIYLYASRAVPASACPRASKHTSSAVPLGVSPVRRHA